MPTINVSRQIDIDVPINTVYPLITEFKHWPSWSPWLCQEREAQIDYHGPDGEVGSGYSWSGTRIGAGSMQLSKASPEHIACDLSFLKPFKSQAEVNFHLEKLSDESCRVQWSMQSALPFFLFWMKKPFEAYIGGDYTRGLSMLKELAETGEVKSEVLVEAISELPATDYIALSGHGTLAELGPIMQQNYPKLESAVAEQKLTQTGPAFCHYTVMDPVRDRWQFIVALPISGDAATPGFERGTRPALKKCARVTHLGHYQHLGNAWATAFAWMKAEKQQHLKKMGGFELYYDRSSENDETKVRTEIYVPLK